jgi:hypothetical protein
MEGKSARNRQGILHLAESGTKHLSGLELHRAIGRTGTMGRVLWAGMVAIAILSLAPSARADVSGDDFNDNLTGAAWSVVSDDPGHLALAEQKQRLELISSGPVSSHTDALYLSNGPAGFRLSTASDFHLTLDYSFAKYQSAGASGDSLALDFGVGRDAQGTESAAVGFGYAASALGAGTIVLPGGLVAHRTDDLQTTDSASLSAPVSGTFDIAYNSVNDDLTLSIAGGSLSYTLADTVKGVWGASDLLVSLGGRGSGFTTASGDAFVDNFSVVSGQLVPVPEPGTACVVVVGSGMVWLKRRRRL